VSQKIPELKGIKGISCKKGEKLCRVNRKWINEKDFD